MTYPFYARALCLTSLLALAGACKDNVKSAAPPSGTNEQPGVNQPGNQLPTPPEDVSAFRLDEEEFMVTNVTTGLQTYIESETVVLTYVKPTASDYVEILRCKNDVKLISNSGSIAMADLDLAGLGERDREQFYLTNDVFALGASQGCSLVSDGFADDDHFYDTFAPSGSFRYFVRSCVHPRRLTDKTYLSGRNCSRRFGVSKMVTDYTNKRRVKEIKQFKKVQEYASKLDMEAGHIVYLAKQANEALDACAVNEQQRAIQQRVRQAWVSVGSAILDVTIELKTAQIADEIKPGQSRASALLAHYTNPKDNWVDMAQLVGSTQGALFSGAFTLITSSAADMPRTCASHGRITNETTLAQRNFQVYAYRLTYHRKMVELAIANQNAADGIDIDFQPDETMPLAPQ